MRQINVLEKGGLNMQKATSSKHTVANTVCGGHYRVGRKPRTIRERMIIIAPALRTTLSSESKHCLLAASQYASKLGHSTIEPKHILLGLIKAGEGDNCRVEGTASSNLR
jgi:ATP-dependent Clp protease ATP-binding subunit ClpA